MFEGFPKELPDLLWELALNNEKPWFEAHRSELERCLQKPFRELGFEMAGRVADKWPDAAPALHISRIHRDARRLKGRGPYNDHLWFTLAKSSGLYDIQPCLWFEIGAASWGCGLGFRLSTAGAAERWRAHIDAEPARLERLVRAFQRQSEFVLGGELYKRPKSDPGKLLFDWYNSRMIDISLTRWFEPDPPGAELSGELMRLFSVLMPLYNYMCEII